MKLTESDIQKDIINVLQQFLLEKRNPLTYENIKEKINEYIHGIINDKSVKIFDWKTNIETSLIGDTRINIENNGGYDLQFTIK